MPSEPAIIRTNPSAPIVKRLEAWSREVAVADALKTQVEKQRNEAKDAFFTWLDAEFGTAYSAVYGVKAPDLQGHRLARLVTSDRTVDVDKLAKLIGAEALIQLASVSVSVLEAAVTAGIVSANVAREVLSEKEPKAQLRLLKPADKITVPVAPAEVAYWERAKGGSTLTPTAR